MILNLAAGLLVLLTSPAWLGHLLAAHIATVWQREPERVLAASGALLLLACVAAASRETQLAWMWPGDRLFRWLWILVTGRLQESCEEDKRSCDVRIRTASNLRADIAEFNRRRSGNDVR